MDYEDLGDDAKAWVDALESDLQYVADMAPMEININGMRWFDQYQGPYGYFEIKHFRNWKAWSTEDGLFIENFVLENNDENESDGFIGSKDYLIDCLSRTDFHQEFIRIVFTGDFNRTIRISRE